ncbi:MAG: class I SAM-dependent RNA methyltransferase [Candidatus Omnitrophica bacterium]|nr:class I SAM-dependent RNA methyltransferase [Candidatus Omnitrophota bacterium]
MPEPACLVYGRCGGCQYQHLSYDEELRLKDKAARHLLAPTLGAEVRVLSIMPSPKIYHYRNRLDLKLVKTRNKEIQVGFSPLEAGPILEIAACPIAMEQISNFIPELRRRAIETLPPGYRMANLTVRCGDGPAVHWGGIGEKSLRLEAGDYFYTDIAGQRIFFSLDSFFQANLSILPDLRATLRAFPVWSKKAVFFDLYGGVGLFSLWVHDLVLRAVNIEENIHAVRLARHNIALNKLPNVVAVGGRVENIFPEVLKKISGEDHVVMVDPPRGGLSDEAVRFLNTIEKVRHLIYLSCNPETLVSNLGGLTQRAWRVRSVQPFDFFPRTRHLETLVLLERTSA